MNNIQHILTSKYSRQNWQELIHTIFNSDFMAQLSPKKINPADSKISKSAFLLGIITLSSGEEIAVYESLLQDNVQMARNKVAIRNLLRQSWKLYDGAFIASYQTSNDEWRFSFISETKGFDADGQWGKVTTHPKRYTYLLGSDHPCRTAKERFTSLANKEKTLDEIKNAFSVEALNKEFFDRYKKQYEQFCQFMEHDNTMQHDFAKFLSDDTDKAVRDYVKKMLGRIVFLYFVQKKGWMGVPANCSDWTGGDRDFLHTLFEKCTQNQKDNFLDEVLEPIFFNCLNTDRTTNGNIFDTGVKGIGTNGEVKIPYLNGGLFEKDKLDEPDSKFPANYFNELFDFFAQYNFTIDENDPNDAEIGVVPEMLGKIFENLLEENKDKGAFYTPKEIVQYMCIESLIAYLTQQCRNMARHDSTTDIETEINQFVKTHQMPDTWRDKYKGKKSFATAISDALQNVKICDPAIGSGAFPMGLLNELFYCREAIEGEFSDRAEIKKHIVQNNIYGVDIEKGAVDIARLRFWLALVVDEKEPQPLPNLDYKIMQGNSLLESFEGVDLSNFSDNQEKITKKNKGMYSLTFDEKQTAQNIQLFMKQYFNITDHKKKAELRAKIDEQVKQHIILCGGNTPQIIQKVNALNQDNKPFFLWHTYFADVFNPATEDNKNTGFDIVIGNPPYINISNLKPDSYRESLKNKFYSTKNKTDLYAYFIEQSFSLAKANGTISFIIPETWKATDSFSKLRELILKRHTICQVVNLKIGVFDAVVKPMILILNNKYTENSEIAVFERLDSFKYNIKISEILSNISLSIDTESSIQEKHLFKIIEKADNQLGQIISFSRGIKTSNDSKFVLNEKKNNDCKKVYRGRNIKAYSKNWNGEYIWYRPDLMKEKVGCVPHSKKFFEVPEKLITQRVSMQLSVAYDDEQEYFLDTTNISNYSKWDKSYSMKFICGLLNSRVINFWYSRKYRMPTIGGYELNSIPFPSATAAQQKPIIALVEKILAAKKQNPQADIGNEEAEIDRLVYALYGLNEEDVKIIEKK